MSIERLAAFLWSSWKAGPECSLWALAPQVRGPRPHAEATWKCQSTTQLITNCSANISSATWGNHVDRKQSSFQMTAALANIHSSHIRPQAKDPPKPSWSTEPRKAMTVVKIIRHLSEVYFTNATGCSNTARGHHWTASSEQVILQNAWERVLVLWSADLTFLFHLIHLQQSLLTKI